MRLRWTGSDATSGLQAYDVWGYGGRFDGLAKLVADTTATSFDYLGDNYHGDCGGGSSYNFTHWVVAKDNRGNTASSALTAWDRVRVWEETGGSSILNAEPLTVTRTGTWRTVNCTCFSNGRTLASSVVGASLTYQVTTTTPGQRVAVVMEKAANRGRVNISVDGGTASVVDTYSSSTQHRVIVWQQTLSPGSHTVKLTNAGTSGRPRIDVDGVLLSLQPTGAAPEPGNPIS